MSKGENKIAKLLIAAGMKFHQEYIFSDLYKGKLRFDFYIPSLNTLIEFDGEQHYIENAFGRTKKEAQRSWGLDRTKNSYALAHKIKLYRIPYWEISKITTAADLFNPIYLVHSRNHNDVLRQNFIKSK